MVTSAIEFPLALSSNAHIRDLGCRASGGTAMRLAKTSKARDALDAGKAGAVDLRERRILILADGKRTREELIGMLGDTSAASIERLVREGYLASADDWVRTLPPVAPAARPAVVAVQA